MSNRIFVDSGFVIALINQRDQYHNQALQLADRFENSPLLTTDAVLLEIGNALSRSHKQEAAAIIEYFLTSVEVEVVHLNARLLNQALVLYRKYQDKAWSLVDCLSFVVMQEADIVQVLSFDQHFTQAGFRSF
ncbi:PIN domain nuclease [filamentous cyanobacterium CCP1]|nr:PIN domain nuclease [filamentous cyanobacterium CCP2]PSB61694.1 PIN domain nuclease [filamentous cyanobacterium CCP1]